MKRTTIIALFMLALSSSVSAAPSAEECAITDVIESPAASFIKIPIMFANPVTALLFAGSSYRQSQCPRPEVVTRAEAQRMIDAAVAQAVQTVLTQQTECTPYICPKTMTASSNE